MPRAVRLRAPRYDPPSRRPCGGRGCGATTYVLLREACLRGLPLPLAVRIFVSGGSVVALRAWEWLTPQPLLLAMHQPRTK